MDYYVKISRKNRKLSTFGKKEDIKSLSIQSKIKSDNTYIIKFPNDFKKFKCNVEYYADFRLLKLCKEGIL